MPSQAPKGRENRSATAFQSDGPASRAGTADGDDLRDNRPANWRSPRPEVGRHRLHYSHGRGPSLLLGWRDWSVQDRNLRTPVPLDEIVLGRYGHGTRSAGIQSREIGSLPVTGPLAKLRFGPTACEPRSCSQRLAGSVSANESAGIPSGAPTARCWPQPAMMSRWCRS